MNIETHPLKPFLPQGATILMLGSFPPARKRWCMDFFYPNFGNDMWRIFGLCLYGDKNHFVDEKSKTFRKDDIEQMLIQHGIALYDTTTEVVRTKNTASDKDLQVVRETDIAQLLTRIPQCRTLVATGEKAALIMSRQLGAEPLKVGRPIEVFFQGRPLTLIRMPSSSRAYPLPLEKKAEAYATVIK